MKKSVYEATTDMFIKRCEARIAAGDLSIPWKKTWDPSLGMPRNMVSGKAYRGSNVFFTLIQGYTSPFWLTRKQVKALGGEIKTQEDGSFEPYTPITFWWFPDRNKPKDEGRIPFAKFYQVWNTEQVSGIEDKVAAVFADMGTGEPVNPIAEAQAIVDGWKTGPEIAHGGGRACYTPAQDRVSMPQMQTFETGEDYYRTLFHELLHSTGHRNRLERDGVANPARFASHEYSEEELIAEMGAAMLAGFAGIASPEADDNSAAYRTFWLKKLRAEPKLLEMTGRAAQKGVDLIRGVSWEKAK
jgi:antirestriction protein ArdC